VEASLFPVGDLVCGTRSVDGTSQLQEASDTLVAVCFDEVGPNVGCVDLVNELIQSGVLGWVELMECTVNNPLWSITVVGV
jgi:hypothetical protein